MGFEEKESFIGNSGCPDEEIGKGALDGRMQVELGLLDGGHLAFCIEHADKNGDHLGDSCSDIRWVHRHVSAEIGKSQLVIRSFPKELLELPVEQTV
jgi:hypothetical protein